jgi:hypothetical protein
MRKTESETKQAKSGQGGAKAKDKYQGFSDAERAAMKERARELKAEAPGAKKGDGEADVREKIAAMPEPFRAMGERLHEIIRSTAPGLSPKTWYGMPAYANKDGKVICFFRSGHMFKERYMTLGFNQDAHLEEGNMWPIAFALTELGPGEERAISALIKRAAS